MYKQAMRHWVTLLIITYTVHQFYGTGAREYLVEPDPEEVISAKSALVI